MFPLHPETPEEGQSLERLFNTTSAEIERIVSGLQERARSLGLPFGEQRSMTYNSRLAQELGLWAEDETLGDKYHMAAFKAYFVDGVNLAKHDVLLKLVESVGLNVAVAKELLEKRTYSEQVDSDWQLAREMGITAVPTFVMGEQVLVGAQSYHTLKQMVELAGGSESENRKREILLNLRNNL